MFAFEGHLSYDVKARLWASLDGNFWTGGRTTLNGVENSGTLQRNSRIGGTIAIPVSRHQSLKFSYNRGAYILYLSLIHISEPTRQAEISYAVFCLKKKKK